MFYFLNQPHLKLFVHKLRVCKGFKKQKKANKEGHHAFHIYTITHSFTKYTCLCKKNHQPFPQHERSWAPFDIRYKYVR